MTGRKRLIAYTGIALLVGLALVERATNSVKLVPARVVTVTSDTADRGPNLWRVTFELSSRDSFQTDPTPVQPQLAQGDPVCLRQHERSWATTKYTLTSETSCLEGVVTPLRDPD